MSRMSRLWPALKNLNSVSIKSPQFHLLQDKCMKPASRPAKVVKNLYLTTMSTKNT